MEIKNTKAREQILNILKKANSPLNVDDISFKVRKYNINLSTIYRTLNTFVNNGIIKKELSNKDNKYYYSYISIKHYHILECNICHKKIRLDYCPFEGIEKDLYDKYGFEIDDENSIIYGICKECLSKK